MNQHQHQWVSLTVSQTTENKIKLHETEASCMMSFVTLFSDSGQDISHIKSNIKIYINCQQSHNTNVSQVYPPRAS